MAPEESSGRVHYSPTETPSSTYFRAATIASAMGLSKRTVLRRAETEAWPSRVVGNHLEYVPPVAIQSEQDEAAQATGGPRVTYAALSHDADARKKVAARESVIEHLRDQLAKGAPKEVAIASAILHGQLIGLNCSCSSVRRWDRDYALYGLDGLVEQKRGVVGRKSIMSRLDDDARETIIRRGKALGLEHGAKGRLNIARAARELMSHPDLPHQLREHLHEGHASKSYVTPSIRAAIRVAPQTAARAQGTRHARLSGRWTPHDYSDVKAMDWLVSDDMTWNGIAWCEWPSALGFRLGQPQLLPVLDVGTLRWLTMRIIMRASGAYVTDDIAGLFGDTFDEFGLPKVGFILEGNLWQTGKVIGAKTGIDLEDRIGGLKGLGLEVYHAHTPGEKAIEERFNQLQYLADRFPGYIGREQRHDVQERVKALVRKCESGELHPRTVFPHISQVADHIRDCMAKLNHELNDGVILRGQSPLEKWAKDAPVKREIPADYRWLYRSAMSVSKVTRNGVRVKIGTGPREQVYYYDNPQLVVPLEGLKVAVYWNDYNPDADAVLLSLESRSFLGVVKRVATPGRFARSGPEVESEKARKAAAAAYSRSELRSIQPELARMAKTAPITIDDTSERVGRAIRAAADRAEAEQRAQAVTAREVRRVDLSDADRDAGTADQADDEQSQPRMSEAEISQLFES